MRSEEKTHILVRKNHEIKIRERCRGAPVLWVALSTRVHRVEKLMHA